VSGPSQTVYTTMSTPIIANKASFHEEARYQMCCAVCGTTKGFNAHHVLYAQILEREYGLTGNALYDTRNALRICTENGNNCHSRHHHAVRKIMTVELTDENVAYVFEVMGLYGADWLRRYYDDDVQDSRIVKLESELRVAA
jgi:hypothetical protein